MRIIHTADWHLGQHFMGKSREPEHRAFLDWLLKIVRHEEVDALIIAGDVYDTGAPPSYARQLYNRFVVELLRTGCQLVVVAGNHDSVAMLEESSDLLHHIGVRQIARPAERPAEQVIELYPRDNRDKPGALVCAVPFVRPQHVVKSVAGQDIQAKQHQLQSALADHYHAVFEKAVQRRTENNWDCPVIATGHLTTVGATSSDSVRDIYIGTLEAFPASGFPPADYIALGHIHGAQKVGGSGKIRYSGSPIPLSFDESGRGKDKSVVQLIIESGTTVEPQLIPVPQYRSLVTIRGDLDSVEKQLAALRREIGGEEQPAVWLEIQVETQGYLTDLQQRVAELLEGCNAELLLLRRHRQVSAEVLMPEQKQTLNELSVDDIFEYRLEQEFGLSQSSGEGAESVDEAALKERLQLMYRQVVSEVQGGEA